MKSIIVTLLLLPSCFDCMAQKKPDPMFNYVETDLFREHKDLAASMETNLRELRRDALEKQIPKDKNWRKDNADFLEQVEKLNDFFPVCNSTDHAITFSTDSNGLNKTMIQYNYSCRPENLKPFDLRLYFYFYWKDGKTKTFEVFFVEMPPGSNRRVYGDFNKAAH